MIKYLGSKRRLIDLIVEAVRSSGPVHSVLDLFSGTSRVGHALKASGYQVLANDHNAYAQTLATCYVQTDLDDVQADAEKLLGEFAKLPGKPGYFVETFCRQSRYFQPRNGERIQAIRQAIADKGLAPELEAVMLVSLMEAADRVDSTTGVQMAYLKTWAARSNNDLQLRMPRVLRRAERGKGAAYGLDALQAATQLSADLVYLDPPYNQHSYLGNYHVWETLIRWDEPESYGIARKRIDCRDRKSVFNSRRQFDAEFRTLIHRLRAKTLIVSFSDEGYLSRQELEPLLAQRGKVRVVETAYPRYVGAQIGIYNPQGEKVGKVSHLRNKEYIYVVDVQTPPVD